MAHHTIQEQVLALAGIAQAAALADQLARTGTADQTALAGTVHSILMLDAESTESVFLDRHHLQLGLRTLRDTFEKNTPSQGEILRYCASLLHLQRRLARRPDMLATLSSRLQQIQKQVDIFGGETHSQVIASLAALYVDTISTFRFRIQVNGNPQHLQQTAVADQIRTVLLGGIRSVMLWRQLGGSRLDFLFKRRAIFQTTLALLDA